MQEDEDWLWRPVMRGMLPALALIDRGVDLSFVALCNEAITVELENQRRRAKAERAHAAAQNGKR